MIQDIIIVDNAFKDPENIIRIAKTFEYFSPEDHPLHGGDKSYWSGLRTKSISSVDKKLFNDLSIELVFKSLAQTMGQNKEFVVDISWDATLFFHQLRENHPYQESWLHKDPKLVYAGVVYLNKSPKANSGTTLYRDDKSKVEIENKFNRLVLYRSDYFHTAGSGFGDDFDSSRLTLTLFFKEIHFNLTHPKNKEIINV
jgi:hypothetical protein